MTTRNAISQVGILSTLLGECPVWDTLNHRLWLMDCRAGKLMSVEPETGAIVNSFRLPAPTGSFAFNHDGQIVVALKESIVLLDPATGTFSHLAQLPVSHPNVRLNDGTALPDGSFIVGTMHVHREPGEAALGGIFQLRHSGQLHKIAPAPGVTNGPNFSPFDNRFYVCDSAVRTIFSYRLEPVPAAANNATEAPVIFQDKQIFADTSALDSAPDGCCFDSTGGLWTALVHAGAVVRFDPDGSLTHRIDLPVKHPTSLCFGGPELQDMFITSIRDSGRLKADGRLDGAVLKIRNSGFQGFNRPRCSF